MKTKLFRVGLASLICSFSSLASAGVITIGNLTLETAGDIFVTDHVNNVDYMRWDQELNMTLADTIAATAVGGTLEGWAVAHNLEANNFTNALLADTGSNCSSYTVTSDYCGSTPTGATGTGNSSLLGTNQFINPDSSYAMYVDEVSNDYGRLIINSDGVTYISNLNLSTANIGATGSNGDNNQYGFLLYRDSVLDVSSPPTVAIFALSLLGLAARRLKKKS